MPDEMTTTEEIEQDQHVFKLVYRLFEDIQKTRIAQANRIDSVIPKIPDNITPPRGSSSWTVFFANSKSILEGEEKRILTLADRLLRSDAYGEWLLAQKGIAASIAISILGECWPMERFKGVQKLWAYAGLHVDNTQHCTECGFIIDRANLCSVGCVFNGFDKVLQDRPVGDGPNFGKAVRKQKGVKANWNQRLKTRMWVFSDTVIKVGGIWKEVYDRRKIHEYNKFGLVVPTNDDKEQFKKDLIEGKYKEQIGSMNPEIFMLIMHKRSARYMQKMLLKDLWRISHGQLPLIGVVQNS